MAKIQILNPNDQPTGKWRLINELRACLASGDYHTLLIAVAFAKTGPLLRLHVEIDEWLAKGKKIFGIFGANHKNTSRQALELAFEKFTKAYVLFHSDEFTYHPKMYLFVGHQKCRLYIGSHNLTVGGTETNWESGTEISLQLPQDKEMLAQAMAAWDSLLSLSAELEASLIQRFADHGKLSDEADRQRRPKPVRPPDGSGTMPALPELPRLKLTIKPPSPLPKSLFAGKQAKKIPATTKSPASKPAKSKVSAEALVIQIVPHHNGEVFLSKMAVNQNPDFFGFPFTGRTTPKKPSNPSYPQREPDPIVDLKVYRAGKTLVVHHPRLALNTVFYETKAEIRITVPSDVVRNTPHHSILVMWQAPEESECDYEMEVFPPTNPEFREYLAVCNQTLPSGGRENPRRMGWL